jgi:hypothetical protein
MMKLLPFLIIGAAALLFMGLAGKTYTHTQPKINRAHHEAALRAENIRHGFDLEGLRRLEQSN